MQDLRERTKQYALRMIRMYTSLPNSSVAQILGKQVLRSGTSVAANYREASRARTDNEFVSKMGIVEQELDESLLWLELLTESGMFSKDQMTDLIDETEQLLRIVVTCGRKTKVRMQSEKNRSRKTTNAKWARRNSVFRIPTSNLRIQA